MAVLGGLFGRKQQGAVDTRTPEQIQAERQQIAQAMYSGAVPFVDQAYKSDPATGLANSLIASGSDTSAVGGWGEGLARVAQGLGGGLLARHQRKNATEAEKYWGGKGNEANRGPVDQAVGGLNQDRLSAAIKQAAAARLQAANAVRGPGAQPVQPAVAPPPQQAAPLQQVQPTAPPPPVPTGPVPAGVNTVAGAFGGTPPQGAVPAAAPATANFPKPRPVVTSTAGRGNLASRAVTGSINLSNRPATGFESHRSQAYDPLEDKYGKQYGVPPELIRAVRLAGEKSDSGAVSEKGAKTVYQFTPETRQLWIKNKGYDPWASPENSVRAAAEHLADDFKATGGNINETALRYIAGGSGEGRGRVTRAYARRVVSAYGQMSGGSTAQTGNAAQTGSTPQVNTPNDTGIYMPEAGSQAGATGTVGYQAPQAPVIAEAALPDAPTAVARPSLGDRVRSSRLAVAQRLLANDNPEDAAGIFALSQPYLDKGYEEDQASKMQRDENEAQLTNIGYQADKQLYNTQAGDRYKAQVDEFGNTRQFNRDISKTGYEGQIQGARDAQKQGYDVRNQDDTQRFTREERIDQNAWQSEENFRERQAKQEQIQRRLDDKMALSLQTEPGRKEFSERTAAIDAASTLEQQGNTILGIMEGINTGGLTNAGLPGEVRQRYDPAVAELDSIRASVVANKFGGKLGGGVSNSDVAMINKGTLVGSDVPADLVVKTARQLQAVGARNADFNQKAWESFAEGTRGTFLQQWRKYTQEVNLFDPKTGEVNPNSRKITYDMWKAASEKAGQ